MRGLTFSSGQARRARRDHGLVAGDDAVRRWRGRRGAAATAGGLALVVAAGVATATFASARSPAAPVPAAPVPAAQAAGSAGPPGPPAPGAVGHARARRDGRQRRGPHPGVVLRAAGRQQPMPTLSPHIAGAWQVEGDTAVFTPASGYLQ